MKKSKFLLPSLITISLLTACGNDADIIGEWVQPVIGMQGAEQGFVLVEGGKASSVNMATLQYETWQLQGSKLILSGKSIGNHQVISFTDTLNIETLTQDSLILTKGELTLMYAKREKPGRKNERKEAIPTSTISSATITFSVKGILTIGPEIRSFKLEESQETYWIVDKTGKLYQEYDRVTNGTKSGIPVHAELDVVDIGKSEDGFSKDYKSVYAVHKIDTIYSY